MLARRFLWMVAGLIVIVLAGAFTYRVFERQLLELAMVPTVRFEEAEAPDPGPDYADPGMWIARPDIPDNPAQWLPTGFEAPQASRRASVFFIHPTSYLERSRWNAPIDDKESQQRARLFVRHQASAFNGIGDIWAPKYRQATFGAFLTTKEDAQKALDFAYKDVLAAFETFLERAPRGPPDHPCRPQPGQPSSDPAAARADRRVAAQGPGRRRLCDRLADLDHRRSRRARAAGLRDRRPGRLHHLLAELRRAGRSRRWSPRSMTQSVAPDGTPRAGSPMLCVNPLTGNAGDEAAAEANLGTIFPNDKLSEATLRAGHRAGALRRQRLPADRAKECPGSRPMCCPATTTTSSTTLCSGRTCAPTRERRLEAYLNPPAPGESAQDETRDDDRE